MCVCVSAHACVHGVCDIIIFMVRNKYYLITYDKCYSKIM